MEKTFKEVIRDIKKGEVWESLNKSSHIQKIIFKEWGINFIFNAYNGGDIGEVGVNNNCKFTLRREKVDFQTALKAYGEGKEIKSCISDTSYNINIYKKNLCVLYEEIQGSWYIYGEDN